METFGAMRILHAGRGVHQHQAGRVFHSCARVVGIVIASPLPRPLVLTRTPAACLLSSRARVRRSSLWRCLKSGCAPRCELVGVDQLTELLTRFSRVCATSPWQTGGGSSGGASQSSLGNLSDFCYTSTACMMQTGTATAPLQPHVSRCIHGTPGTAAILHSQHCAASGRVAQATAMDRDKNNNKTTSRDNMR